MRYKPWGIVLALWIGLWPATGSAAYAATNAVVTPQPTQLAEAVAAIRNITTLRADFIQTDTNGQQIDGVLLLKQPRKFRFQYAAGYPVLIVSDGRALTMIDYETRQVQRWPLGYTPIGALLTAKRDISRHASVEPGDNPGMMTVRLRINREYGDMELFLARKPSAPGGLELMGWDTTDAQNKRTTVRLAHQQYGGDIPESTFAWVDPRHARPNH